MSEKQTYPIQGIPRQFGATTPLRQEITAWYNNDANKYQVSLFIQALQKFMQLSFKDRTSYYQVAGIHSYPRVSWDGAPTDGSEYCAHEKITFPTWHRPYMLLYEQVLYELMKDFVDATPSQERPIWQKAREEFRLPYWDWARIQPSTGEFGVPQICTLDTITIVGPEGKQMQLANPLAKFVNPAKVPMGDKKIMGKYAIDNNGRLPWSKCIGTSRYGIFSDQPASQWEWGVNNFASANAAIAQPPWYARGEPSTFADAVGRMLQKGYLTSWSTFSSTKYNPPEVGVNTNYMSLEYIHNNVHNATGGLYMSVKDRGDKPKQDIGLGHMSDVPVAAFDPIFWLHHANVDRLCAIWQTFNWSAWFDDPRPGDPKPTDALQPFHTNTTNGSWTSTDCRSWWKYNYQYDDLADLEKNLQPDGSPTPQYVDGLRSRMNKLYPSTSDAVKSFGGYTLDNNEFHDYIINVIYDRYALDGQAYSIMFFLGDIPDTLNAYRQQRSYLGQVYTFSAPVSVDGEVACSNCAAQQSQGVLSKAQVPITIPLLKLRAQSTGDSAQSLLGSLGIPDVEIGPLDPEPIEVILRNSLKVLFVEIGGEILDQSRFPGTEIKVLHGKGRHADSSTDSVRYSGYKVMSGATRHTPYGFVGGEDPGMIRDDE